VEGGAKAAPAKSAAAPAKAAAAPAKGGAGSFGAQAIFSEMSKRASPDLVRFYLDRGLCLTRYEFESILNYAKSLVGKPRPEPAFGAVTNPFMPTNGPPSLAEVPNLNLSAEERWHMGAVSDVGDDVEQRKRRAESDRILLCLKATSDDRSEPLVDPVIALRHAGAYEQIRERSDSARQKNEPVEMKAQAVATPQVGSKEESHSSKKGLLSFLSKGAAPPPPKTGPAPPANLKSVRPPPPTPTTPKASGVKPPPPPPPPKRR